jgi:broad specificity phosphatase PhoE
MILFCLPVFMQLKAQQLYQMKKGVIYIVRHAEKDAGNDPGLSAEGFQRSRDLDLALKQKVYSRRIDRVYVTQYRRTQLTAEPIRISFKTDTAHYMADVTGDGLIAAMERFKGKKDDHILIIGHSNTIPIILKRLGIYDYSKDIPDNEYDNLFTVTYRKGIPTLTVKKYGKPSAGVTGKMNALQ